MRPLFALAICISILAAPGALEGQATASQRGSNRLTPEQSLQRWQLSDLQIAQDGQRVALVVTEPVKGTKRQRHIWVYEVASGGVTQFTNSEEGEGAPRWSPDGSTLAFLSSRSGSNQIFVLSMSGGEGRALTTGKNEIESYAWSPDGGQIAFLAPEPKSEAEEERAEAKDDARVVDDEDLAQLWIVDVETREVRQLTDGERRISEYAWVPPGDRLVISGTDNRQPELDMNSIYVLNVGAGDAEFVADPPRPFGGLGVSPDGQAVAFVATRYDGPTQHDLWLLDLASGTSKNLTAASLDRPVGGYDWISERRLAATVATGFTSGIHTVDTDGSTALLSTFEVPPFGSFAAKAGVYAFVGETTSKAPELWISRQGAPAQQVTHFNESWDESLTVPVETIRYRSYDGTTIEAGLLIPPGRVSGQHLPLVVLVHGGPTGRWADRFHSWGQLLVTRGFVLLYPNIRGSTGYGHEFLAKNRRDWGGGDFQDVMAGVDHLIEQGFADPNRLGIGGWSYGGYMAAWAVTQTNRFKASVSGAPMTDLASEYGTESAGINAYDTWFMGTPYENLDLFVERSPVTHVRNASTPTLILCGEDDQTDPIGQCQQFHRGLKRYDVETRLVLYPREGHGIREEKHQLDVLKRMLDWFEKYMK